MSDGPLATDRRLPDDIIERYAAVLQWGVRAGMVVLVIGYLLYLSGALPAYVPHDQLVELWSQPHERLREAAGLQRGWGWLALVGHGDMLSLLGIAVLASLSIVALAAILPAVVRSRDRLFAVTLIALLMTLLYAATGFGTH